MTARRFVQTLKSSS